MPAPLRLKSERGQALLETALTMPLLLLVVVGIFEFGRAYQTWQVVTNAAREGARVAVLPYGAAGAASTRVMAYLESGQIASPSSASVAVTTEAIDIGGGATAQASRVTVAYPFTFMVLQPIAQLVVRGATTGAPLTMTASAVMRNE
jgi:Flp pilus assembly protein TadG